MRKLNNKGQFAIEAVLLAFIFVGIFIASTRVLRENKVLAKLIGGPWTQVQGMVECGIWGAPSKVCKKHPNNFYRSTTWDPSKN